MMVLACGPSAMPFERTEKTVVEGVVTQVLQAGPYTYVHVSRRDGAFWVATLQQDPPVGSDVRVTVWGRKTEFHSKRLERTFDQLAFGMVQIAAGVQNEHQ
jgi:hypothetical protein